MARFVTLTMQTPAETKVHINIDQIAYFERADGQSTTIYFAASRGDQLVGISVRADPGSC